MDRIARLICGLLGHRQRFALGTYGGKYAFHYTECRCHAMAMTWFDGKYHPSHWNRSLR